MWLQVSTLQELKIWVETGIWSFKPESSKQQSQLEFRSNAEWYGLLATYTVTNTNDSGAGSLRQAIIDSNNNAGADDIVFNISGTGVHVFTLSSLLPNVTGQVTINAATDDSFAANSDRPAIVLDGADLAGDGFVFTSTADGSILRGFVIETSVAMASKSKRREQRVYRWKLHRAYWFRWLISSLDISQHGERYSCPWFERDYWWNQFA